MKHFKPSDVVLIRDGSVDGKVLVKGEEEMLADEELALRALNGDRECFAELVVRYEKSVFALAYRMVGNREDARDIAQEAFLKAYRALATFKEDRRFSPWLYSIANHLCVDYLRRKGRNNLSLDQTTPDGVERQIEGGEDPSDWLEKRELQLEVRRALNCLPAKYKSILILRHMQELSYEEIAQVLGISVSLVKTHLFRAREALRKQLTAKGEGGKQHDMSKQPLGAISRQ